MIKQAFLLPLYFILFTSFSQTITESTLPIVEINTAGQSIPNDGKITATLEITFNGTGSTTKLTDVPNIWNGEVEIGVHGASSQGYPQKSYGFTTMMNSVLDSNIVILDMPREHDWLLINNWNDKSFSRNALAQKLFSEMGHYAVRMRHCEVVLNGAYNGIYLLAEKIKVDKQRVSISKLKDTDNSGSQVSGGYILKNDVYDGGNGWQSKFSPVGHSDKPYILFEYPSASKITTNQRTYIKSFIDSLETALYGTNFKDPAIGFRKFISEGSFIDYFILNELVRNVDGFKKSSYWHKDRWDKGGKLKAGPVWDFDWSYKNIWDCSQFQNTDGSGWSYKIVDCPADVLSFGWFKRLLQDPSFANKIHCRWDELRKTILDESHLDQFIDSVAQALDVPKDRHFTTFPVLGQNNGAPEVDENPSTYSGEVTKLKNWIHTRVTWLDKNMVGTSQCPVITEAEKAFENDVRIFPIPAKGWFTIQCKSSTERFSIHNQTGAIVKTGWLTGENTSVQCDVANGLYFLRIGLQTYKVVINQD